MLCNHCLSIVSTASHVKVWDEALDRGPMYCMHYAWQLGFTLHPQTAVLNCMVVLADRKSFVEQCNETIFYLMNALTYSTPRTLTLY